MKDLGAFIPLILIFLVFWLLVIRPQRKRQLEMTAKQNSLVPGSDVMLGSGIFGTVVSVDDQTLALEVAPGTTLKVAKQAVVRIIEPETPEGVTDLEKHDDADASGRPDQES